MDFFFLKKKETNWNNLVFLNTSYPVSHSVPSNTMLLLNTLQMLPPLHSVFISQASIQSIKTAEPDKTSFRGNPVLLSSCNTFMQTFLLFSRLFRKMECPLWTSMAQDDHHKDSFKHAIDVCLFITSFLLIQPISPWSLPSSFLARPKISSTFRVIQHHAYEPTDFQPPFLSFQNLLFQQ